MVPLLGGAEDGGVSCRSYRHTVGVLLALADRLSPGLAPDVPRWLAGRRRRPPTCWTVAATGCPAVSEALDGPAGTWVVAAAAGSARPSSRP